MESQSRFWDFLYNLTDWVMRLAVPNMYCFLFNIPFLFVLTLFFWIGLDIGLLYYLLAVFVTFPFLAFPAIVALFATTRDWVLKREQPSLTKAYFQHWKANYKQSTRAGFIFALLWIIWVGDVYYFQSLNNMMFLVIILVFGAILFVFTMNYFSLQAHYHERVKTLLQYSFFYTVGRPLATFLIMIIGLSIVYVSFFKLIFLIPFFTFSLLAFLSFEIFYWDQRKIRDQERTK